MSTLRLIIQSLCIAGVISTSYKKKLEAFFWCSLFIGIVSLMDVSKIWMLYIILFLVDSLYERKIRYVLASQIFLGLLLQSFCELVALLVVSFVEQLPIMVLSYNLMSNFETTIAYLGLLSVISTMIYHYNLTVKERRYSKMLGLLFVITYYIIQGFLDALLYGNITLDDIQKFSLAFIAFGLVLMMVIFLFNQETEAQMQAQKVQTQESMVRNNLLLIDGIQSNIQDLEHRMNYVLLSLKHLILDNKKADALQMIQENTWNLKKVSYYVNTGNPYFDNLFSHILKNYIDSGIVPSCVFEVKKKIVDQHIEFVSMVITVFTQLLDKLNHTHELSISLHANHSYFLLKLVIQNMKEDLQITLPDDSKISRIDNSTIEIKIVYEVNQEL